MPKQICKNQNISDVNATCITFYLNFQFSKNILPQKLPLF